MGWIVASQDWTAERDARCSRVIQQAALSIGARVVYHFLTEPIYRIGGRL